MKPASLLSALLAAALVAGTAAAGAGTLDKARAAAKFTIGYNKDARPFSYQSGGKPAGYAIPLCDKVAEALKAQLNAPTLVVEYVPVTLDEAFRAVDQGRIDLLCGAVPTLERRTLVDFSIPILLTGTGVAVRSDAPLRLTDALAGRDPVDAPVWRGSTDQAPQHVKLAVVAGLPLEKVLGTHLKERRIYADVVQVKDPEAGLQLLAGGGADAFFHDRLLLVEAVGSSKAGGVKVLDRLFRRDFVALGTRRNDDEFRLLVDFTLSRLYRTQDMSALYTRHFGPPNPAVLDFFDLVALPD